MPRSCTFKSTLGIDYPCFFWPLLTVNFVRTATSTSIHSSSFFFPLSMEKSCYASSNVHCRCKPQRSTSEIIVFTLSLSLVNIDGIPAARKLASWRVANVAFERVTRGKSACRYTYSHATRAYLYSQSNRTQTTCLFFKSYPLFASRQPARILACDYPLVLRLLEKYHCFSTTKSNRELGYDGNEARVDGRFICLQIDRSIFIHEPAAAGSIESERFGFLFVVSCAVTHCD